MKKRMIFSILTVTLTVLLSISFFDRGKKMNIDINKIEKIECSSLRHLIGEYSDISGMTMFVDFLNSFVLTERYENIDCQRPSTDITIYYKDGSTVPIEYSYTSLVYRGKRYKIDINRTDELDCLLYPGIER